MVWIKEVQEGCGVWIKEVKEGCEVYKGGDGGV